ncbi:MAG TPA: helix-turn-helix domain-containing GNAT family N-acetyltransferase [Candidatus Dormibacteraeota bacterium]|nr:helix-turn-helix domain-containing GNAT family N-acetyltransferase [Candidatus Dormibacteraeota bacterium]
MDEAMIAAVRRFNRTVTQRVGALDDRFLARDRSLGEARVLWEIGAQGRDLRSLRATLELDSGYLSRLMRSLEAAGLVTVGPKESDRRVRSARLTGAGLAERAVLDRRSDELAASLLAPLSQKQRTRLVAAMVDVERLLTAATVEIAPIDPAHPNARHCLREYFSELDRRFDSGFDPVRSIPADEDELRPPAGLFLVASLHKEPIGSGALKFHGSAPAELKRMWVAEAARGLGVGRRLLAELERHAAANGARKVRLETNKSLIEAISLYRSAGYLEVAPFNAEPYAHHWFEKDIASTAS